MSYIYITNFMHSGTSVTKPDKKCEICEVCDGKPAYFVQKKTDAGEKEILGFCVTHKDFVRCKCFTCGIEWTNVT